MFVALQCAGIGCVMGVAAKICKMDKSLRSNVASSSSRCIKEKCIVSRIVLEEKEKKFNTRCNSFLLQAVVLA